VLTAAGLASPAGTRQVRGGTEHYYRRAASRLEFDDAETTAVAFRALAAEIAATEPDPLLVTNPGSTPRRNLHRAPRDRSRLAWG
jgi:hypothetical protein